MNTLIFQRHELKYLVDRRQRSALEQALQARMAPDPHGESTICNIYYDTPDFRLIRASLEKPIYKEKLRLRSYGPVTENQEVFLELKKKYNGIVYKRRTSLSERAATDYLAGTAPLPKESQFGREVAYVLRFYEALLPAVHLSYDRMAYFCKEDPNLRMTFDQNIRWRTTNLTLTAQPGGQQLLTPGTSLLEIKAASALPLWLVKLLDRGAIRQISFSKYGSVYETLLEQTMAKGGVFCA